MTENRNYFVIDLCRSFVVVAAYMCHPLVHSTSVVALFRFYTFFGYAILKKNFWLLFSDKYDFLCIPNLIYLFAHNLHRD